jgi:Activator of Hsp90 ATPase homolog 1-like protein
MPAAEPLEMNPMRFSVLDCCARAASGSWRWTGGAEDPGESLVEIRLRAVAEGTELTFTHSRLHDEESRRSHEEGWTGALDKLERHLLVIERSSP